MAALLNIILILLSTFWHTKMRNYEQNGPFNLKLLSYITWFNPKVTFERKLILCIDLFMHYQHSF